MKFLVVLEEEDGYIVAECQALPGCVSQGKTAEEALANIREAIQSIVAIRQQHKLPIPEEHVVEIAVPAQWRSPRSTRHLSIPDHNEPDQGTLRKLIRYAGITVDAFLPLLQDSYASPFLASVQVLFPYINNAGCRWLRSAHSEPVYPCADRAPRCVPLSLRRITQDGGAKKDKPAKEQEGQP